MIDLMFILKFTVAVSSVVILSELFERINPKIASVLSGYPVGVALSLFFFGLENGAEFASQSAVFNIVGIVTFLAFIGAYYLAARIFTKFTLILSVTSATAAFLLIAYLLEQIKFNLGISIVVALLAIIFLAVPFTQIRKMQTGVNVRASFKSIVIKALVAGSIITTVTTIAGVAGSAWAGLLASFPATTLPLMLMVHRKYSVMHLHALLKYIPIGSISIVCYAVGVYYFYPTMGIYVGTLLSYALATVPILLLFYVENGKLLERIRRLLHMVDKSKIHFIMTGGTIDFHYERRYDTVVPNKTSIIPEFIETLDYVNAEFTELFVKDSRRLTNSDFAKILKVVEKSPYDKLVITTGTFKIDALAKYIDEKLTPPQRKTIILTGSTTPISGFTPSEGLFNLGHAVACAQRLDNGVYISFNGELFAKRDIERLIKEGGLSAIFQIGIKSPVI